MPQIQKHRKIKRATVIIKRSQCLRNIPTYKSYKPLCEKLKSNNNKLAKALSKEKQECQFLFSQNVALRAEVQDLGMKCNKRDDAIVNILQNSKEMLEMLVTVTGYLTNTISSCQEIASSTLNLRMSCSTAGRRDSYRRLSVKSPTKGVVKPMVSGHTITKPTINLSRVNMRHINNPSNLSMIEEVPTPPRSQSLSNPLSPVAVPVTQHRYENSHACRMPERVAISSPRSSEENERRLSKRSIRHSGRISGRRSRPKSSRLSGNNSTRSSIENFEYIGSPRVKLNDVSKLLQNSQSINIRMLEETRNDEGVSNLENSGNVNEDSQTSITIPETPPSGDSQDDNDKTIENNNEQIDNGLDDTNDQTRRNSNEVQNLTSNLEDPLEGPSWLFNNLETVPCYLDEKTDNVNVSSNDSMCITLKATDTNDTSDSEKSVELTSSNRRRGQTHIYKTDKHTYNKNESIVHQQNTNNAILDDSSTSTILTGTAENEHNIQNESTVNLSNFVTQRRGCFESEDEDDFTLMFMRQPRNIPFDINDLKLPVLEESALKPIVSVESEPEITTTIRKISQIGPIPSLANNSLNESTFSQSMVKLPLLINNDYDNKDLTQSKDEPGTSSRKKKVKKVTMRNSTEFVDTSPTLNRKNNPKKKNKPPSKDPSSAKVVLQKLDESDVKSRTPTPEEITHDSIQSLSSVSLRMDNSTDSDSSSASTNSTHTLNRPRRRKAPISMQEPNLRKKMRRNR